MGGLDSLWYKLYGEIYFSNQGYYYFLVHPLKFSAKTFFFQIKVLIIFVQWKQYDNLSCESLWHEWLFQVIEFQIHLWIYNNMELDEDDLFNCCDRKKNYHCNQQEDEINVKYHKKIWNKYIWGMSKCFYQSFALKKNTKFMFNNLVREAVGYVNMHNVKTFQWDVSNIRWHI